MTARIANRDAARYCETLTPFQGSNLRGSWNYDRSRFEIVSYWTLVAFYDVDTDRSWVTPNYYSPSTQRQLSYVRRGLPRIVSNDPEAIDGIGAGCTVRYTVEGHGPKRGYVREVYPLAKRFMIQPGGPGYGYDHDIVDADKVRLA